MAESFFGFETSLEGDTLDEGIISDEDEEDYDALNDETFGGDAVLAGDWEEDHEKLAEITELSRHSNANHHQNAINENGDLSAKIAAFILDDDPEPSDKDFDRLDLSTLPRTPRPPPGFSSVTNNNHLKHETKLSLPPFKNVCTVEEIERNLIKPPANSLRLEDIERNLIPKPNHLVNLHHAPGFISVPRHHPLLSNHLQKMPSVAPFPLPAQFPPFALQAGALRIPPPPPLMRLGPGRPVPQTRLPLPPPQLPAPPGDEYAGLMTPKEKQWLASIQLMQLSTNNPFQDDYYYLMFQHRQQGAHGRKGNIKLLQQVPSLTKHTYTPLQFENSLGKLQVGSVMAPRKIIDTDVVESVDCPGHGVTALPSSRKIKQLLLEIEHLFSSILLAEEVLSSLATNPPENVNPTEVFTKAVNALLKDDKLRTVLSIRKGKNLVLRILPHTDVSGPLAERLIIVLPTVAKRDTDQTLLRALPAVRHYLATTTLNTLNTLGAHLQPHLAILLENKLGVSVLANMIERAESILTVNPTSEVKETWLKFLSCVVSASCDVEAVERPVVGIPSTVLARHLSRLPPSSHSAVLLKAISNTAPS